MAGLPDLFFARASERNNKLKLDLRLTPPWQVIHFLLNIGFTCVLNMRPRRDHQRRQAGARRLHGGDARGRDA